MSLSADRTTPSRYSQYRFRARLGSTLRVASDHWIYTHPDECSGPIGVAVRYGARGVFAVCIDPLDNSPEPAPVSMAI
jgi:hypothetical protein